ncbi:thyroglobulin-like [Neocloeon triangulifer]|uniref:thyroglobulin-like n=1 Tax=Neocloeon triangulifer TaxID=2078957 RepID=UPI00286F99DF|nr:thyroglobulin-like [Neocloeon triangulifer]
MSNLKFILTLLLFSGVSSVDFDLRCTSSVCQEWLSKNECTPKLEAECVANGRIFSSPIECGCCDYCVSYLPKNASCNIGQPGQPTASFICGGGLTCMKDKDEEHATCKRMNTECHTKQDEYDEKKENGTLGHLMQWPVCDDRGQFATVTCIPGSVCYCTSPKGDRLFGEVLFSSQELMTTMRCGCSRDAWNAAQIGLGDGVFFAHCLPDGSYDPLQCVDGNCVCIDREGGIVSDGRVHVALLNVKSPNCFNASLGHTKASWARPCEIKRYNRLVLDKALRDAGVMLFPELPNCGLDGRYERVQAEDEELFCSDEFGEQIENFRVGRSDALAREMNCHCARTRYLLKNAEAESSLSPDLPCCCLNGNFQPWQCVRGLCYCVNEHGAQIDQEVPEENLDQLTCYDKDNACC